MTEASASGPAEDHVLMLSKEQVVMRKDPPQSLFLSLLPPPVFRKEKIQDCTQMLKRTVLPAEGHSGFQNARIL